MPGRKSLNIETQLSLLALMLGCMLCSCDPALAKNSQKTIYLEADKVSYSYQTGIVHYEGNVKGEQGDHRLRANEMYVFYNQNHKIDKIQAIGNLAQFKTLLPNHKGTLTANALTIFYFPATKQVILKGQAKVVYNQSFFIGSFIAYDIDKQTIRSHPQGNSQTKIVLEPAILGKHFNKKISGSR